MRHVRREQKVSERIAAERIGLSRDQLRRIERAQVAVRFFPAWHFCQFTNTNPLWLAFGEPEARHGFIACANSSVPTDARFLQVISAYGEQYRTFRFLTQQTQRGAGDVFSDNNPLLRADFVTLNRRTKPASKKNIGTTLIKRYLIENMAEVSLNWDALRAALRSETESPAAKADLAMHLRVTPAAISQWRSGVSAPTADKTLRLLAWVERRREAKQKNAARATTARAAQVTRERKARSNANPKSR